MQSFGGRTQLCRPTPFQLPRRPPPPPPTTTTPPPTHPHPPTHTHTCTYNHRAPRTSRRLAQGAHGAEGFVKVAHAGVAGGHAQRAAQQRRVVLEAHLAVGQGAAQRGRKGQAAAHVAAKGGQAAGVRAAPAAGYRRRQSPAGECQEQASAACSGSILGGRQLPVPPVSASRPPHHSNHPHTSAACPGRGRRLRGWRAAARGAGAAAGGATARAAPACTARAPGRTRRRERPRCPVERGGGGGEGCVSACVVWGWVGAGVCGRCFC
jgi:hypothetical protein